MKPSSFFLRWLWAVLLLSLGGMGAAQAQSASGQACAAARYGSSLNCTANDVAITQIAINRNGSNPIGAGCTGGTTITLDLNVTVQFNKPDRYDIGIFLSEDGKSPKTLASQGGAQTCSVSVLPLGGATGLIPNPFGASPPTVRTAFQNANGNVCGDGGSSSIPLAGYAADTGTPAGTGTATFVITGVQVPCQASASGSNKLGIPFLVSWEQNSGGTCSGPFDVKPTAPSKCNAPGGTFGDVDVVALPQITKTNAISSVSPGDTTTYTITVSNTTGQPIASSVFRDPAVTYLNTTAVSCSAQGGALCPASVTVAGMQGASGLPITNLPAGGSLVFTVNATVTGNPPEGSNLVNSASVTVAGVANSALDSDQVVYPHLVNQKQVTVISDPVRGTTNPLAIPGAVIEYTITLSNTGQGRVDSNTLFVTDAIPANTALSVTALGGTPANSPVTFTDGTTPSNLTVAAADIQFSNDNGATWGYTPVSSGGYDSTVTHVRVNPKGRMAAASSFAVKFRVRVN
jgi:uncharacterized repeat protein (TIGR01451 family)